MDTYQIFLSIKDGNPYKYPSEGKTWTIEKKGKKFKLSHDHSDEIRLIPERAVQRILNHIQQ